MEVVEPAAIEAALRKSWSAETSYSPGEWTVENPARSQCAVSALVTQDYLGGKIIRKVASFGGTDEKHYLNEIEGLPIDTTKDQFPKNTLFTDDMPSLDDYNSLRDRMLDNENTAKRYKLLSSRVRHLLG